MEELYIRVGTTIYKVVQQPLVDGTTITRRIQWSFGTIRQDYGKNNIPPITKYNGFCTVPSHINYQKEVAGFYNLYEPITHIPVEGDSSISARWWNTFLVSSMSWEWTIFNCYT